MSGLNDLPIEILEKIITYIPERPFKTEILLLNKTLCCLFMAEQVRSLTLNFSGLQHWIAVITKKEKKSLWLMIRNPKTAGAHVEKLRYRNFLDKIHELSITTYAFSDKKMLGIISRCTRLRKLTLEGIYERFLGNYTNTIFNYLPFNIIEIHFNKVNLEDKYAYLLAKYVRGSTILAKLHFYSCNIQIEGGRVLEECLKDTTITELNLTSNEIDYEGARVLAKALKQNTILTSLNLSINVICDEGACALAEALKQNIALSYLNLEDNGICANGARALAEGLKQNRALANLNLSRNRICDKGARALAEGLKQNKTLTNLDLRRNNICVEGACALAEGLEQNKALTKLNLRDNYTGVEGARALGEGLRLNITLTNLNLKNNHIGAKGTRALSEGLKHNTTLTNLNLRENNIGSEGVYSLLSCLRELTCSSSIGDSGVYYRIKSLRQNSNLTVWLGSRLDPDSNPTYISAPGYERCRCVECQRSM